MTMPIERARAIRWVADLLELLADDPDVAFHLRAQANNLRLTHPTPGLLKAHLLDGTQAIPAVWVAALQAAGRLFATMQHGRQGSSDTRHRLAMVLRHYPDSATAALMAGNRMNIREWLVYEDPDR